MTQTLAKLKFVTPRPVALKLGHAGLKLKAQLRLPASLTAISPVLISQSYAISLDMAALLASLSPLFLGGTAPVMDGVGTVGVALTAAHSDHVHPTDTSRAPLASPALTGVPTAPTAAALNNSAQIATTAYLDAKLAAANGVATLDGTGKLTASQIPASLIGAVVYQGTWNATTNSPGLASGVGTKGFYYKVSTAGATAIDGHAAWNIGDTVIFDGTVWDKIDGVENEVISVAGKTGVVTLAVADVSGAAPLASPALTGTPTAPTAAALDSTTKLATTAYADAADAVLSGTVNTALALKAPLASPALTGAPTAPTATVGDNSTKLATTAFVLANGGGIGAASLRNYLAGLTLSTAGASTTFSVAAGLAIDSTNSNLMTLAAAISKTTAAWVVGTTNGALDTGAIAASTWYHVWQIERTDLTAVDVLISLSASAPTMPANYTYKRRIGSMKTNGSSQWVKFVQLGDEFLWDVAVGDVAAATGSTAIAARTMTVPTGVQVNVQISIICIPGATNNDGRTFVFSPDVNSPAALCNAAISNLTVGSTTPSGQQLVFPMSVRTNTSAQIKTSTQFADASLYINTFGWVDTRGRNS